MNFNRVGIFLICIFQAFWGCEMAVGSTIPPDKIITISTMVDFSMKPGNSLNECVRKRFNLTDEYSWELTSGLTDKNLVSHNRYQQFWKGIKVENAVLILHLTQNASSTINGIVMKIVNNSTSKIIHQNEAIQKFQNSIFQKQKINPVIKSCELVWVWNDATGNFSLQYKLAYQTDNSLELIIAYSDAVSGLEISQQHHSCYADVPGIAHTSYHGTQNILTIYEQGSYQLKSTSRGQGIETKNLNQQLNYNSISEFTDSDNNWMASPAINENFATDAHFSAEQFYDFLMEKFNRNSIDNSGQKLISYLNYGSGLRNAFWNGNAVVYGSGNATGGPLTTLDIAGHEFTHGLIQKTANLNYSGEPGTINEAVADIFGTALEHYSMPQSADWLIGEKSGPALRSMSNPELYNQPSTYQGNNWYAGTGDNGGVHINSGFINKWYYLLSAGGQGTNTVGINYNVQGITINKSLNVVYHALTCYTIPSTGFRDFMNYTLQSAVDLYGVCSPEYLSVLNAWKAVGLFDYTTAQINISSNSGNSFCEGDSILLTSTGLSGSLFAWYRNGVLINSGNMNSIYVLTDGAYSVTESRCGSLHSSEVIHLNVLSLPVVNTSSVNFCEGETILLSGFPTGGTFSVANPYVGPSTTFTYNFTNSSGCKASATADITVHAKPLVNILNTTTTYPENGGPILLLGNVAGVFSGYGVTGNNFHPEVVLQGGPYPVYLSYTNAAGCSANDSILFSVSKPCRREFESLSIAENVFVANKISFTSVNINASFEDFDFEWVVPASVTLLSGINDSILSFLTPETDIEIKVNLTNTCGETISKFTTIHALKQKPAFSFSIHPNPAKEIILIETNDPDEIYKLRIIDAKGMVVQSYTNINSREMLNLSGLSKGVYSVELQNSKHYSTKKLVIN